MRVIEAKALLPLLWPEFVEHEGGLFLAQALPSLRPSLAAYPDLTTAETLHNHIHILDEFDHGASLDGTDPSLGYWDKESPDFMAACEIGKQVAFMWHAKLMIEYPDRHTRVYFTSDDNPIVRFHCIRQDEPVWLEEGRWQNEIRLGQILILDSWAQHRGGAA